jgi:predicted oxidoreductase
MTKQEIVKELREILKVYHYESDEQHISRDVVTSLENLIIGLTT